VIVSFIVKYSSVIPLLLLLVQAAVLCGSANIFPAEDCGFLRKVVESLRFDSSRCSWFTMVFVAYLHSSLWL